ncbi:polyphosphate kinase 2 [Paradevosia shaoguanensis]|uniref:ADP/GDP-polyphosphate phosphotransferase n=1 Tax=Paradevosia shaoguanensis TaxID=1335043 RepID=A0AA41QJK2_9HYPH|nr:polyphosphate kinase 2 [Paradevosia shaoguanensis]MCI0125735.1 polyphosphate kinase 2 [Paradevosia shaoguanensis]
MSDPYDSFDIENPDLPKAIKKAAMTSGGYPYADKLDDDVYEDELLALQKQLVLLQSHLAKGGDRIMLVFEGRDAAGKGGTIKTYLANLNPRYNIIAALPKPSDREATQWYFQRYVDWLPAAGETVLFDRSWYNRAGVEPVMGFCTPEQTAQFLIEAPRFERMLVADGIHLHKFWLDIGREMQLKRFHDRRHDPLKVWKLSPIDMEALPRWDAYSKARDRMLEETDTDYAPWTIIRANDKCRARLSVIRQVLRGFDFQGKDDKQIGKVDDEIVLGAEEFLKEHAGR